MPNPITRFKDKDGVDLGNVLITKDYLMSVYPQLANQFISPELWSWGQNINFTLGTGDDIDRLTPVTTFIGGADWKQVSNSTFHSVGVKRDGSLWVWGRNSDGQLGLNDTTTRQTPVPLSPGMNDWNFVSVGPAYNVAIKTDGTLWTWGRNNVGQLGINTTTRSNTPVTTFAGGNDWRTTMAGGTHVMAIKTNGELWAWGGNNTGQLGIDTTSNSLTPVTTLIGGTTWKQVSAIGGGNIAVKTDGSLWTWGGNTNGQLGVNDTDPRLTPVTTFAGGNDWKQGSSGGGLFMAATKANGELWIWGSNTWGNLGTNDTISRYTPVTTFSGGTTWKAIVCSSNGYETSSAYANKTDGTIWVWGDNNFGQLGINNTIGQLTPTTTSLGGNNWNQIGARNASVFAIRNTIEDFRTNQTFYNFTQDGNRYSFDDIFVPADTYKEGTLWAWGKNDGGQLGVGDTIDRPTPVTVFGGGITWRSVFAGGAVVNGALKSDGTLWVWGSNNSGGLGQNDTTGRLTPILFTTDTNWKQVSSGAGHISALKTDGTLWKCGNNDVGQCAIGDAFSRSTPVTTFAGGSNWIKLSQRESGTSGTIKSDGSLWVWGSTPSALGINTTTGGNRLTPVTTFVGGNDWKEFSIGNGNMVAIKNNGTLWTWGVNAFGEVGIGNTITQLIPVQVGVSTNWKSAFTLLQASAAIKTDGTLWMWGRNTRGELGVNDTTNRLTPVEVYGGGTTWKKVTGRGGGVEDRQHVAALKTDGTLWVWGDNNSGQLGTGDYDNRLTPTTTIAGGNNWKDVYAGSQHTFGIITPIYEEVSLPLLLDIGEPLEGGYFAGYISHTANGVPTHALIVAPRATGASGTGYPITTNLRWKNSNTTTLNSNSQFDGFANTQAIITAGINDHPAAKFCVDLNIEGYTDWYLPSYYELEIAYYNLKPTTTPNNIGFWGPNPYSVPTRTSNYTTTIPSQTALANFKDTGSEAFATGYHWTSLELSNIPGAAVYNEFGDGTINSGSKSNQAKVRAFRRIAL